MCWNYHAWLNERLHKHTSARFSIQLLYSIHASNPCRNNSCCLQASIKGKILVCYNLLSLIVPWKPQLKNNFISRSSYSFVPELSSFDKALPGWEVLKVLRIKVWKSTVPWQLNKLYWWRLSKKAFKWTLQHKQSYSQTCCKQASRLVKLMWGIIPNKL